MAFAGIGSCAGALTGTCCVSLLARDCGDFKISPNWVTGVLDASMILAPLAIEYSNTDGNPLIDCLNEGVIASILVINFFIAAFPHGRHKSFYGIRVAIPLIGAAVGAARSFYSDNPLLPASFMVVVGTVSLASVTALVVCDMAFEVNPYVLAGLRSVEDRSWLYIALQAGLVLVSVALLFVSWVIVPHSWFSGFAIAVIVLMSSMQSEKQRGSIVSAAVTVVSLASLSLGSVPVALMVLVATVYCNLALYRVPDTHTTIPLLEPSVEPELDEMEEVRFKFVCNNFLLISIFTVKTGFSPEIFLQDSFVLAMWIITVPFILTNRVFHD